MTTMKPMVWASPLTGAWIGAIVAGFGLLKSHLAFYFAVPILILGLRSLEAVGIHLAMSFESSTILLAVLSPVVFACYGAAVIAPNRSRTRAQVVMAIVVVNVFALAMLAL